MIKDIQTGYLISPYFKDIYLYLAQNKLPSTRTVIRKVEVLAEKYDNILYCLKLSLSQKRKSIIGHTRICADKIITLYHASLFAGHQGVIKTYFTINDKFVFQI